MRSGVSRRLKVIVLCKNEADSLGRHLEAVLGQEGAGAFSVTEIRLRLAGRERMRLIPPGVDLPTSSSVARCSRPTVVTVSRIEEAYKGHDVIPRALSLIKARVPNVRWVAVGDGSLRPLY
jgi:glycosyltransferase involved in cell wall biosynthesis